MKNVFFDFNGTILDDVDLCLDLLNKILIKQNKKTITKSEYKQIFRFPIKEYYRLAGVDFSITSYEDLAIDFITEYQPKSLLCSLVNGFLDLVSYLNSHNINCYILSASETNNLLEQCISLKIDKYFKGIIGIDNIHAESKIAAGKKYIKEHNIDVSDSYMIGDTTHDYEVSLELGLTPVLFSGGHQSRNILESTNSKIIDNLMDFIDIIDNNTNIVIKEDFSDFNLSEFPYDHGHTAVGEYQYVHYDGYYGNFYDPISLHQYRSLDGSWLVTESNGQHFMEQNRGDNATGAFKNVYSCLVHKTNLFASYVIEYDIRIFELKHYCGIAFNYITSRNYYAVGMIGEDIHIYKRYQENITVLGSGKIKFDDLHTYHFKVIVSDNIKVYVDKILICSANLSFIPNSKIALVAKSACRYSNILVTMSDSDYTSHLNNKKLEEERLINLQNSYPKLKCIKKINLANFGSGRQLRIRNVDGRIIFVIAQHQKRMIRDSFARLSCLTAFDIDGNILWQIGEPNNSIDNTLISCDLPFQIADINNDGKFEVIYSMDFEIRIIDLLTGKLIKKMPTPIIHNDPLVKNEPFYRLNVDQIRVADFEGLGYKGDFIIKDRYQNVWAYDNNMNLLWRYHHKNTGHFPYIYDFDNDGKDEMLVGYDLIDNDGKMLWSLPMNSDHTDEIIYARLNKNEPKRFVLASGNEGLNIVNIDGTIYKHNEIGHAQRISVARYDETKDSLEICATAFWGSDGIVCMYDCHGNLLHEIEMQSNGNVITPVVYDGKHILALLNSSSDGGLVNLNLDKVVKFPNDNHPTLASEVYDIDNDGIDEILCFDQKEMWIYKAEKYTKGEKYIKYTDDGFSNYRGEYLLDED